MVCLAPAHPLQTFHHQPFGVRGLRLLRCLANMARLGPDVHLLQQLLAKLLPAQTPSSISSLCLESKV